MSGFIGAKLTCSISGPGGAGAAGGAGGAGAGAAQLSATRAADDRHTNHETRRIKFSGDLREAAGPYHAVAPCHSDAGKADSQPRVQCFAALHYGYIIMRALLTATAGAMLLVMSTAARADPPFAPGSEIVDPWAPAAKSTSWRGPSGSELVDPWPGRSGGLAPADACIVDPWKSEPAHVPTGILPPPEIVNPWAR